MLTERLKKDIVKLLIDEVVIEGESVKIFATIPLPNKIHEREMEKTDIPVTFNARATLGQVNETNMARIWNKHKQIHPVRDSKHSNGAGTPLKRKVFVALSGGVDSAVSASLLYDAGYDVLGVFIKHWQPDFLPCTWREERRDAMRVCAHLGIPFETVDLSEAYKRDVADYFIREYAKGRTPNPDVMCNKYIKFGAFRKAARKFGANMIATGHYARINRQPTTNNQQQNAEKNSSLSVAGCELFVGVDGSKDQSYFLWTLTQDILMETIFPVGHLTKSEVRRIARQKKIPVAEKKDSQGVCFLGELEMREFLKRCIDVKPGRVLDEAGMVIGVHEGVELYTVGQRHGFRVDAHTPHDRRRYVVARDIEKNTITVSEHFSTSPLCAVRQVLITDTNWIGEKPKNEVAHTARVRYRGELLRCMLRLCDANEALVLFERGERGVNPGQSLVVYENERCVGGGVIDSVVR